MASPQVQAVRRWIMTGSVTAITAAGTIYGAGLKTDQDVKKVCPHRFCSLSCRQTSIRLRLTSSRLRCETL
jgi:hypothetical protein